MKWSDALRHVIAVNGLTQWNPKKMGPAIKRIIIGKVRAALVRKVQEKEQGGAREEVDS